MKDKIRFLLATAFGLGMMPLVPGSWGALLGVAWHAVAWLNHWIALDVKLWCLTGIALFSAIHWLLTPWAQKRFNDPDPKNFVLDEVVGYLCVPVFTILPPETTIAAGERWPWGYIVAAFVIFRILDAIKLPGARYVDRNIHNAFGVLFDDVISAAYTAAILSAYAFAVR